MHKKWLVLLAVLSLGVIGFAQENDSALNIRQDLSTLNVQHEPPMLGIHWARASIRSLVLRVATTLI
jgi:hypothetical protein